MIKTRLVKLLSDSKKYIVHNILWQWIALVFQIVIIFQVAKIFGTIKSGIQGLQDIFPAITLIVVMICGRFLCDKGNQGILCCECGCEKKIKTGNI